MKNRWNHLYIVCFFLILVLPLVIYPFLKNKLDLNNYENRELMTKEGIRSSNWGNLFPNLETYIEDYMPYKNESVSAINWVDENVFHDLINQSVMVGKENWLFYKGNDCIQDYRGGYSFSEAELQTYSTAAEALQEALNKNGIKLYIMVTPNKEAIYGDEYLPEKVKKIAEESRADQVVAYLKDNTGVSVIYPKEALQKGAEDYQVWKKYDTHWNDLGAFVASMELLKNMKVETSSLKDVTITEAGECSGDLAGMLGMTARYSDDMAYVISGYNDQINYESTDFVQQSNLAYSKFESDAPNDLKVLFIGDSFLGSMEQFLATNFNTTMFVHRDNYSLLEEDLIQDEKPDVVVFQTAERFLTYFDEYMAKYATMYSDVK